MVEMQKRFVIGDQWLYYKIYIGTSTSDRFLSEALKPLTNYLLENGLITKWFFVRYADSNYHLRVRFLLSYPYDIATVIDLIKHTLQQWISDGLIWKLQVDTYVRETERYRFLEISATEEIFFRDSEMVLTLLCNPLLRENHRWLFSLKAIDDFLIILGLDNKKKLALLTHVRITFFNEFGGNKLLTKQLGHKYLQYKSAISNFLDSESTDSAVLASNSIIKTKNQALNVHLMLVSGCSISSDAFDEFVIGHVHMMMNRIFRTKNRLHELVCYDFLNRYYTRIEKHDSKTLL